MNPERLPTSDEQAGMDWWNGLSEELRAAWLKSACSARPADAWEAYKCSAAPFDVVVQTQGEIARLYREKWGYVGKAGVVVFYNGEVQGWVNELRDPQHWVSGCVAIDENNQRWQAVAGDAYNGALMWVRLDVDGE